MAKIKLGQRPANFRHIVTFPMLDGSKGSIEMVYRYRTRKEFGQFVDEIFAAAKEDRPEDGQFSMAELMEKTAGSNAAYIMQAAEGWNLDEDFTLDNVQQLADELPAAATAIMESYRGAVLEGKLGN